MKKLSQSTSQQDQSETLQPDKFFWDTKDGIYIGNKLIDRTTRSVLKDEAIYIAKSNLWEILNATINQEAFRMGTIESTLWDHTLSAKQLLYWKSIISKLVDTLAK